MAKKRKGSSCSIKTERYKRKTETNLIWIKVRGTAASIVNVKKKRKKTRKKLNKNLEEGSHEVIKNGQIKGRGGSKPRNLMEKKRGENLQ